MTELEQGKATICIVNYRTPELTRLCLRSIRKFTRGAYEVLVIDNGSADESLTYLKKLGWIRLIERSSRGEPSGSYSHAAALQLGLQRCATEFFVSMHSDTFVKRDNWLAELVGLFGTDERTACVGTGKIEPDPRWRELLKQATDLRAFLRKALATPDSKGKYRYWNRTVCSIYRTRVLRQEGLSFLMGVTEDFTPGKKLYFELVDRGYKTVELPSPAIGKYVVHLPHATQVTNPEEFRLPTRAVRKYWRQAKRVLASTLVEELLADEGLDR